MQAKAAGETGQSRKTEEWFSQMKSDWVGEVPLVEYELSCIVSLSGVFAGRRTTVNSREFRLVAARCAAVSIHPYYATKSGPAEPQRVGKVRVVRAWNRAVSCEIIAG